MSVGTKIPPQESGRPVSVSADGAPIWMDIGVTIAWSLVPAVTETTTLDDGTQVFPGEKAIRYGTVLVPVVGGAEDGKYAPFDSTETDGREVLARDNVGILNQTRKESENYILGANRASDLAGLIVGGLVWGSRLAVGGAGQPALDDLRDAMPLLRLAKE